MSKQTKCWHYVISYWHPPFSSKPPTAHLIQAALFFGVLKKELESHGQAPLKSGDKSGVCLCEHIHLKCNAWNPNIIQIYIFKWINWMSSPELQPNGDSLIGRHLLIPWAGVASKESTLHAGLPSKMERPWGSLLSNSPNLKKNNKRNNREPAATPSPSLYRNNCIKGKDDSVGQSKSSLLIRWSKSQRRIMAQKAGFYFLSTGTFFLRIWLEPGNVWCEFGHTRSLV